MNINDLTPKMGKIDLVAEVVDKGEPRSFDKFGKQGKVCDAKLKDDTGEVKLTLWNEQVDQVNVGDRVHIQNGWADEFRGSLQVSTGKFGTLEVVSKSNKPEKGEQEEKIDDSEVSFDEGEEIDSDIEVDEETV